MNGRTTPRGPWSTGGGLPSFTPAPTDLLVLVGTVFVTFSLQFFQATRILPALLRLTPAVWRGFFWQVATYPFIGYGGASFWILLELLILYWFGRDVYYRLGRRGFWTMLLVSAVIAGVVAEVTYLLTGLVSGGSVPTAFVIMQGQRMLLAIFIAAFATLNRNATILLFFVLPIQARWFLWLEVLFAFIAFLGSHDLPGFLGITTAVLVTWGSLSAGGPRRMLREWRLRAERWRLQQELDRERKRRKMKVIDGGRGRGDFGRGGGSGEGSGSDGGPWVH
jgi:hypothetical protein